MIDLKTAFTLTKIILALCAILAPCTIFAQKNSDFYRATNSDISKFVETVDTKNKETYSITITVTGIRNIKGVIRFKFYDDTTPFPHDKGFLRVVVPKSHLTGDSLQVTYSGFTSKNMAIALLDDENDNWKLDLGWIFPKEGHAFSDYYHTSFRKPTYDDFRFFLKEDKKVLMKMRYY